MDGNSKQLQALLRVHKGLPRQGPGSAETTLRALRLIPPLAAPARIYDLGCGPGRASVVLAGSLKQQIVAVDMQEEFLNQLRKNAQQAGLSELIKTQCGDMLCLGDEPGTVHLIWCEGAIYCVGFDRGLTQWRPFLADNGMVACTELSWLSAAPSPIPAEFWGANYPGMRSVANNIMAAEQLGYACADHFTLPESCWWDEYYNPLLGNIEMIKQEAEQDDSLQAAVTNASREIDLFQRYSHEYGYEFYLLQKSDVSIRRAQPDEAKEIARLFRRSLKTSLPFLPTVHTADEDWQYFSTTVIPKYEVLAGHSSDDQIVGFIGFDDEWVHHLYVSPEFMRQGIGRRLLNMAKAQRSSLKLWAFQKNEIARRFYTKQGFIAIRETSGEENDEKEPDILFQWKASG